MNRPLLALLPVLSIVGACSREPPAATAGTSTAVKAPAPTPADVLDQIDTRSPVPLLPMMAHHQKVNMRDHLVAVQEIVVALSQDDFAGVERAAGRIGFSEQMGQQCSHMGAGAPGFTEQALHFHHTADRISEAAREKDGARVLTELGATLQTCTACHAVWKQQVVDDAAWTERTSSAPPTHGAAH